MTTRRAPLFAAFSLVAALTGGDAFAQDTFGDDPGLPGDEPGLPADETGAEDTGMEEAAAPAAETSASAESTAGFNKKFFLKQADGPNTLRISGRVQGRYTYEAVDGGDDESAFSVARARVKLDGHAFSDDIGYTFQADFGKGNVVLKDYWIDYMLKKDLRFRVGQWKRPFSRQQITSSGKLELVDRAITDKAFGAGRDIGLAVGNKYDKSPEGLEWVVGIFNGTGDKPVFSGTADPMTGDVSGSFSNVPDMFGPAIVARAGWNSPDLKGYSEADLEGGPFRYGVAASTVIELDADDDNSSSIRGEVDYIGKVDGLTTSAGVYIATAQDDMDWANQAFAAFGFHAQAGYMLSDQLQPAARVALVSFDDDTAADLLEVSGGVSYYLHDHGFKWQTDIALLRGTIADTSTNNVIVRSQLQLAF